VEGLSRAAINLIPDPVLAPRGFAGSNPTRSTNSKLTESTSADVAQGAPGALSLTPRDFSLQAGNHADQRKSVGVLWRQLLQLPDQVEQSAV
jgi:hypothetical protein